MSWRAGGLPSDDDALEAFAELVATVSGDRWKG